MTTKVQAEFLAAGIISDQTQVSAADADHVLIFDASDNSLKKALVSTITSSGASAADDITAGDAAVTISTSSGNITIDNGSSDDDIIFKGTDGGSDITALTLDMSDAGRAMFNGSIDIGGSNITRTGDLTIDVTGDILLDADGENVKFLDGGVERGQIDLGSGNFTLRASSSNADMIFRVNDGGTEIVAMTIDASEAANIKVESGNVLMETAGKYVQVAGSSSTYWAIGSTGGSNPPGTASTSLAFHHWDGSAWNNEVEFNSSGDITLDGKTVGGVDVPAARDIELNDGTWTGEKSRKIQAHSGHIYYQSASHVFRNASGTNVAQVDGSGNFVALANITAYGSPSDIKLKENIEVIDNAVDKVKQLKGITYTLKSDGNRLTGLIAQDLEKVLPEAVYTSKTIGDEINDEESEEHLAIRYGNTVGLLVEAIKELEARVKELEGK